MGIPIWNSWCFHFKNLNAIPAHQHVAQFLPPINKNSQAVIIRSAAPARRQRGAGRQRYSKALENNKYQTFTLHRIHTYTSPNITGEWWTKTRRHCEETEDLPSRSWRALRWRRWRGCHTRIWFWMNERGPLCSSEQTKSQAERNCTRRERERQRRVRRGEIWQMSLKDIFLIYMVKNRQFRKFYMVSPPGWLYFI